MSLLQIVEGWKNYTVPDKEMKEAIAATRKERMDICNACPFHSKNHKSIRPDAHCTSCGCTLSAKTSCLTCSCPEEKWLSVINAEDSNKIENL